MALAALLLGLALAPTAHAQLSFGGGDAAPAAVAGRPWWDLSRAQRCGRYWCSQVILPYLGTGAPLSEFVAVVADDETSAAGDPQRAAEQRSETIVASFDAVVRQLRRSMAPSPGGGHGALADASPGRGRSPAFWLATSAKPLHPLTPQVAIGKRNNATVIFVVENPDTAIARQIIATVTANDARHAGTDEQTLAERWRELIHSTFNIAAWGLEFDRRFPWARLVLMAAIAATAFVAVAMITTVRRFCRRAYREVQKRLKRLDAAAARARAAEAGVEPEVAAPPPTVRRLRGPRGQMRGKVLRHLRRWLRRVNPSRAVLQRQWQSLLRVTLQLLGILRFSVALAGVIGIVLIGPEIRQLALTLTQQTLVILLVWVLVVLGEFLFDLVIDHSVEQWATDMSISNPSSSRYSLRAITYTKVLKGIARLLCLLAGAYATLMAIGVTGQILAGAGVIAVAIGFLSRNLLEDTVNGILILSTDRFAIGDVINVGGLGGFVENMSLANTQLRGMGGELVTIPNSRIAEVTNHSKEWSRVNFEVDISASTDIRHALGIIEEVCRTFEKDPDWRELILQPIEILGVDRISHAGSQIRIWIVTPPLRQWPVGREFRLRIKEAFDRHGIRLGRPQQRIELARSSPERAETP